MNRAIRVKGRPRVFRLRYGGVSRILAAAKSIHALFVLLRHGIASHSARSLVHVDALVTYMLWPNAPVR